MKLNKNVLSDRALKIISLIIAIVLWLYVAQVQSPDIERTVKGVPIVFTQKNALEEKNLILLNDNEHTIDVKIKGRRQNAFNVTPENLTVVADVSDISATGEYTVPTSVVLPYANLEVISKNPSAVTVTVDDLLQKELPVSIEPIGVPKAEYITGNMMSSIEKVTIKGPKSIVSGIEKVSAAIDVSGETTDVAAVSPLKIYGSNNKEIQSPYITLSEDSPEIRCEILKTKNAEIVPIFTGDLAFSYLADSNNTKSVKIAGSAEAIENITEIKTKPISSDDIDENGIASVKLNLPQGVRSVDGDTFMFRFTKRTGNNN